jgi:hypothetical protein
VHGYKTARIASEIARLSQEQGDLLEAGPMNKWTETQRDGYRLRQQRIFELSAQIKDVDLSSTAQE